MRLCLTMALCLLLCGTALAREPGRRLVLVENGKSSYRIVLPQASTTMERKAAQDLRSYLRKMSGAVLPIVSDDVPATEHEIIVGRSDRLTQIGARVNWRELGDEGFTIRTVGSRLIIAGGPVRGTPYGVYTFLESYLGVRWYTIWVNHIPSTPTIEIGAINDTQVPLFDYRFVFCADAHEFSHFLHHKMNGWVVETERMEMLGAHTYFTYVSPDSYFKDHPEYYSLLGGTRQPIQLCLTNPDVLKLIVEGMKKAMEKRPKDRYWAVGQMDNGDACECPDCKAIDDREGTKMGSQLWFVNRIAAEFPDKIITTTAYWGTVHPPKTIKPARNVSITYCTYPQWQADISAPQNAEMRTDIETWQRVSSSLYVWDYPIRYSATLSPFPNWRMLQPNIQYFAAHGVRGVFSELSGLPLGEFSELRTYVLARLLWNPDCDYEAVMSEFLDGFYGAAGPAIRRYIELSSDAAAAHPDKPLISNGWYGRHRDGYLAADKVAAYSACFDEAEKAVADDPVLLPRVQRARMPVIFSQVMLGYGDVDARIALLERFDDIGRKTNTNYVDDSGGTREDFVKRTMAELQKEKAARK